MLVDVSFREEETYALSKSGRAKMKYPVDSNVISRNVEKELS